MTQGPQERPERPVEAPDAEPERYGPLLVRRLRKVDGRALIVYRRDADAPRPGVGGDDAEPPPGVDGDDAALPPGMGGDDDG
jgi:hypothetical protein